MKNRSLLFTIISLFLVSVVFSSCGKKVVEEIKVKHPGENTRQNTDENTDHSNDPIDTGGTKNFETDSLTTESSGEKETTAGTIRSSSAGDHIGQKAAVIGYVADVHITKKVAYLNFDNKYPKHTFTGVIFARSFSVFDDIHQYEGKTVQLTGEISEYKGKPQIILENKNQIKVTD
jgi:hypothetical protein